MEKKVVSDALFVATQLLVSLCDIIASYTPLCCVCVLPKSLQKQHLMLWDSLLCTKCQNYICEECNVQCRVCRRCYCQIKTCLTVCLECECFLFLFCTKEKMWHLTFHHVNDYSCESRLCME